MFRNYTLNNKTNFNEGISQVGLISPKEKGSSSFVKLLIEIQKSYEMVSDLIESIRFPKLKHKIYRDAFAYDINDYEIKM